MGVTGVLDRTTVVGGGAAADLCSGLIHCPLCVRLLGEISLVLGLVGQLGCVLLRQLTYYCVDAGVGAGYCPISPVSCVRPPGHLSSSGFCHCPRPDIFLSITQRHIAPAEPVRAQGTQEDTAGKGMEFRSALPCSTHSLLRSHRGAASALSISAG